MKTNGTNFIVNGGPVTGVTRVFVLGLGIIEAHMSVQPVSAAIKVSPIIFHKGNEPGCNICICL